MSSPKVILLKSSDGETFVVNESASLVSHTIKPLIENNRGEITIPLPNVNGKILAKVIEYCKCHTEGYFSSDEDLKAFDADFVKVDQATLFNMILAANYLKIKSLLDLTCKTAADMIKDMSVDEVRVFFNIQNLEAQEEV